MKLLLLLLAFPSIVFSQHLINEEYRNDSLTDGEHVDHWKNGKPKVAVTIKDFNINGQYISYFKNGQVFDSAVFINGRIDGYHRKFNDEGKILVEIEFRLDTLVSYHEFWYKKEHLSEERFLKVDKKDQRVPEYYEVSTNRSNIFYSPKQTLKQFKSTGYSITYHPNGQIDTKERLVNNQPNGKCSSFYSDGSLAIEYHMTDGNYDGEMTYFDTEGKIWKKEVWVDGSKKE